MKKIFLTVFAIGALASCKKDYYLNDLNDANAQIELLQSKVASLSTKLEDKISENNTNAIIISGLNSDIIDLSIEIENYNISDLTLLLDNGLLSQNISSLNARIEALHFDLADLLAADDLDVEAIAVLTETIGVLEGQTTASVIEYIESVTVIVNTDIATIADTTEINRLNAIIADLRDRLNNLPADPTPTPVDPIDPIDSGTGTDTIDDSDDDDDNEDDVTPEPEDDEDDDVEDDVTDEYLSASSSASAGGVASTVNDGAAVVTLATAASNVASVTETTTQATLDNVSEIVVTTTTVYTIQINVREDSPALVEKDDLVETDNTPATSAAGTPVVTTREVANPDYSVPDTVIPAAIGYLELTGASITSLNRDDAHTVKVTGWTIAGQLEYENAVRNYNPINIARSAGSAQNADASFQAEVVGVVEFARQYISGHERSGISPSVQVSIRYTLAPNVERGYVGGNFSVSYTQKNTESGDLTYNGAEVNTETIVYSKR